MIIENKDGVSAPSEDVDQADPKNKDTAIPAANTDRDTPTQAEQEITRDQLSLRKRLLNWRTIVPLIIVLALLVYSAQKLNINPQQTWTTIRSANLIFFLAAFLSYYLSFPLRALRWRLLLKNVGFTQSNGVHLPPFWKLVEIVYISFFANAVVPAKLGDLYRAYLLRQDIGVSTARSFGTVLAERLLDLIVLLLLFISAIIISLRENLPSQLHTGLMVTLVLVAAGIVGLFLLRIFRHHIGRIVPKQLRDHYNHLQEGTLGSFQRLPLLTILTLGVWACEALRFFFVALSINLISGNTIHILTAAFFIALGEALLTVVPFTGGGVGLVEAGMFAMIALFTPANKSLSAAAILLDRSISLLSILLFGLVVFLIAFGRQAAKRRQQTDRLKS